MKVALICPSYYPSITGGGGVSVKLFAEALSKYHQVQVLSFDKSLSRDSEIINGVKVERFRDLGRIRELKNTRVVTALLDRIDDFDIFHTWNMNLLPAVGFLSRFLKRRTVATLNGYKFFMPEVAGFSPKHWLKKPYFIPSNRFLQSFIKQIGHFVCISPVVRAIYKQNGFDPQKLSVIPQVFNIPTPQITPQTVIKWPYMFRILYVGRLEPEKGVEYLLKAVAKLDNVYLWIVGDGSQRKHLEQLAKRLDLSVHFFGWVPYEEVTEVFPCCDLLVLPTVGHETLGRVVIEAILSGLLPIATNIGGPSTLLPPELLFPPKNVEALATKLREVIKHYTTYCEQLETIRTKIKRQFDPDRIIKQYLTVYRNLDEKEQEVLL